MTEKEILEVESHAAELQEILEASPNWPMRWGITIIFFVISSLFFFSSFIQYPDKLEGSLVLNSNEPPDKIFSIKAGYIDSLFVQDRAQVFGGQILLSVKDQLKLHSLMVLESFITKLSTLEFNKVDSILNLIDQLKLNPELQLEVGNLVAKLKTWKAFELNDYYQLEEDYLKQRNHHLDYLLDIRNQERMSLENDLAISRQAYKTDSILYTDSVLSLMEFRKSAQTYFSKQRMFLSQKRAVRETRISLSDLNKKSRDIKKEKADQLRELKNQINQSLNSLSASIKRWKAEHLLIATKDGIVHFKRQLSKGLYFSSNEETFVIESRGREILAFVDFDAKKSGELKIGQKVIIELDAFPANKYGMLKGELSKLSLIPEDNQYSAEVKLSSKLVSDIGIPIPFKPEMSGKGVVICNYRSLMQRVLGRLSRSVNNEAM